MGRRRIARMVLKGEFNMTKHAYKQMIDREIYIRQVEDAIVNGRIERRWNEKGVEKLAITGERFNGDNIRVVVKDLPVPKVITVCYPYEDNN